MFDTAITDELLATTRAVRRRLDFDRPVDPAGHPRVHRARATGADRDERAGRGAGSS